MATCFLDAEFTNFGAPDLLSVGLVGLDGLEHYVELDLESDAGRRRAKASSDFVRASVLNQWGLAPNSAASNIEMGGRAGRWLLSLATRSGGPVEVLYDYMADWALLEGAIRDAGLWSAARDVLVPRDVSGLTDTIDGELAAEQCYRSLLSRGLHRHHALADAHALRAAYMATQSQTTTLSGFAHTNDFLRLLDVAGGPEFECWLRQWLLQPAFALNRHRPLDIAMEPGGIELLEGHIGRMGNG